MNRSRTCVPVIVVATLFLFFTIHAQQLPRADQEGPPSKTPAGTVPSGEGFAPRAPESTHDTREYGSYHVNGVLSNLGSSGGCVMVPHDQIFRQNYDGSVEAWIRPTSTTGTPVIVSMGDSSSVGFLMGISWPSGNLFFRIGAGVSINTGGTSIPLNTWTHVAAVWTGGPSSFDVRFYVNGVASGDEVVNSGTWNLDTDSLCIGSSEGPFGLKNFYGTIDEVRFWTTARTQVEIARSMFVGIGDGPSANSSDALTSSAAYEGLAASWTFNATGVAYDDIGDHNGIYRNGATAAATGQGLPIPYNFALYFPGGSGDYISVPHSTVVNETMDGTIEAWVKPTSDGFNPVFQKGSTYSTTTLSCGIGAEGELFINIGPHGYGTPEGSVLPYRWTHLAAVWTGGPNFVVSLYINGNLIDTVHHTGAMPTNTDSIWIGRYYSAGTTFRGYIDELRIWDTPRTQEQIRRNMFASGRALLPDGDIDALWNFDGNLLNFSAFTGLNGSFANATGGNTARFSGYEGESDGASHATVINRNDTPNSFPAGFIIRAPFKPIPDALSTGVADTIVSTVPSGVTTVEAFLSIQHLYMGDIIVTLTAPNGQTRTLLNRHGGPRHNALTFFNDAFAYDPASSTYRAPWAYVQPYENFGDFGNTSANGNWILNASDRMILYEGVLQGWGLRFNSATGVEPVPAVLPREFALACNYPNPFNPSTRIEFSLPERARVTLQVFNILGQRVALLADNQEYSAGVGGVTWTAGREQAFFAGSGVYFYRLDARGVSGRNFTATRKMILLK